MNSESTQAIMEDATLETSPPKVGWLSRVRAEGIHVGEGARRSFFVLPVAGLFLLCSCLAFHANGGWGMGSWGVAMTVLEAVNIGLLVLSSWTWFLGAGITVFERLTSIDIVEMKAPLATGRARTAILMPVCNEDPARVFRAIRIMRSSILWTDVGDLDIFVLSDSRDPAVCMAEEREHRRLLCDIADDGAALDAEPGSSRAVHYRRRSNGAGRKAGNIQDFCERWGADYDYMLVLDADSLMSGRAIAHLVGRMDANPDVGIVQAMCYATGKGTLFARVQQWGGRMGGPVLARGLAFWQGASGNWWGHNAIIRTKLFAAHCGLPHLAGKSPLGGEILCHDIVEAALMVRAGSQVRLDYAVGGSWEETPTNIVDGLSRERRWCQGNMQHARIALCARGLAPTSRLHLAMGMLHYAGSLPFLMLLLADALVPSAVGITGVGSAGAQMAMIAVVIALILLPRLVGMATICLSGDQARWWGGRSRVVAGTVVEAIVGTLVAPANVVFSALFVLSPLLGKSVGWSTQARDDRKPGWQESWKAIGLPLMLLGVLIVAAGIWTGSRWVMLTIAPGLFLAVPMAVMLGSPELGAKARRRGLFVTPEELAPPRELAQLHMAASCSDADADAGLETARNDGKTSGEFMPSYGYGLPRDNGLGMPAQVF